MSLHLMEESHIDISIMRAAIQRLREIANYSPVREGSIPISSSSILLAELLEEVVILKRFEWSNKNCQLILSLNLLPERTAIYGSSGEIKSMLSNLLNNAIEACGEKSAIIKIDTKCFNNFIELSISDNGIGIPKNKIKNYLAGRSSKHSGVGLGLSNAKKYMKLLKGHILLSSRNGKGTCVTLQFKKIS